MCGHRRGITLIVTLLFESNDVFGMISQLSICTRSEAVLHGVRPWGEAELQLRSMLSCAALVSMAGVRSGWLPWEVGPRLAWLRRAFAWCSGPAALSADSIELHPSTSSQTPNSIPHHHTSFPNP
jgi:hypothetical protein